MSTVLWIWVCIGLLIGAIELVSLFCTDQYSDHIFIKRHHEAEYIGGWFVGFILIPFVLFLIIS